MKEIKSNKIFEKEIQNYQINRFEKLMVFIKSTNYNTKV